MGRMHYSGQIRRDAHGRGSEHADLSIAPGLFGDPLDGFVPIHSVILERPVLALTLSGASTVLDDESIAPAGVFGVVAADDILPIWRAFEQDGERPRTLWQEDVRRELNAVA